MKHFVVQEIRRWDFQAKSMNDALKKFKKDRERMQSEIEESVICCQETGEEQENIHEQL